MRPVLSLPESWASARPNKYVLEIMFWVVGYLLYLGLRVFILNDIEAIALGNADKVIRFERFLGMFWELDIQQSLIGNAKGVILFFNWFYTLGFFPVIIPIAIFMFLFYHRTYVYYRNVFLLSLAITWLLYVLFPLAPPRLVPWEGFVDTVEVYGPAIYNSKESVPLYNRYSAMPSMHFGWTLLVAVVLHRTGSFPLQIIAFVYPALMFISVVVTANHYVIDPVVGALIIVVCFRIRGFLAGFSHPRQDLRAFSGSTPTSGDFK